MHARKPAWLTAEGIGTASIFFVVQEKALPSSFSFWTDNVRRRIFERGDFPWEAMINDLPAPRFFGSDGGDLPTRAASCRLIDEITRTIEAIPVIEEEIHDRLVEYGEEGQKAVQMQVKGRPKTIGQPKILMPHTGHRVVRIAWCSSVPLRLHHERLSLSQIDECGDGAWCFTPVFQQPEHTVRYLLAFWEVPL
jgi:hypothetical protein